MTTLFNQAPEIARASIRSLLDELGEPAFRTDQVVDRMWSNPVEDWDAVSNLPKRVKAVLNERCPVPRLTLATTQVSSDGTKKYLWKLDGGSVETVMIPDRQRSTLCISSQVGCAYGCRFCATGTMGFGRHLDPWEIVAQVRELMLREGARPTNVVFMGMGEPLHNWPGVDAALSILNDPHGIGIGARHITVSTVGIVPALAKLAARPEQFTLAVSLHSASHEKRMSLMPVERKYPLAMLLEAIVQFRRRTTFEYVMIDGINDQDEDAHDLAEIARPVAAHVNLLPLHPGGAEGFAPSPDSRITAFARRVRAGGVRVTVRRSRGLDISAACGQLRVELERRKVAADEKGHVE